MSTTPPGLTAIPMHCISAVTDAALAIDCQVQGRDCPQEERIDEQSGMLQGEDLSGPDQFLTVSLNCTLIQSIISLSYYHCKSIVTYYISL